jgi:hypothetical protein
MGNKSDLAPETKNAQALRQIDSMPGGISPGIHPSTTYVRDENYQLVDARHGTDKLTYAADRIGTNYQTTKPLHFSKTQTPVVGNIDNASPISNDDPG